MTKLSIGSKCRDFFSSVPSSAKMFPDFIERFFSAALWCLSTVGWVDFFYPDRENECLKKTI